jgi:hypothetical protein
MTFHLTVKIRWTFSELTFGWYYVLILELINIILLVFFNIIFIMNLFRINLDFFPHRIRVQSD